jgi:hypothetical protein
MALSVISEIEKSKPSPDQTSFVNRIEESKRHHRGLTYTSKLRKPVHDESPDVLYMPRQQCYEADGAELSPVFGNPELIDPVFPMEIPEEPMEESKESEQHQIDEIGADENQRPADNDDNLQTSL